MDFDAKKRAEEMVRVLSNGGMYFAVSADHAAECAETALREAYAAGLERAAEVLEERIFAPIGEPDSPYAARRTIIRLATEARKGGS